MNTIDQELLLSELRLATRDQHDRIESVLRLQDPMPIDDYRRVIAGFHDFLLAWEPRLRQALPSHLRAWFDARSRRGFAADDLRHLGETVPSHPSADAVSALAPLVLDDAAAAIGSLYVIEGSALGGQVMLPRLASNLGVHPGRGACYFNGFGERTGAMWREFRQVAQAEAGGHETAVQSACRAAQQTFDALILRFASARRA